MVVWRLGFCWQLMYLLGAYLHTILAASKNAAGNYYQPFTTELEYDIYAVSANSAELSQTNGYSMVFLLVMNPRMVSVSMQRKKCEWRRIIRPVKDISNARQTAVRSRHVKV
jgi:hypothetical protein